MNADFIYALTTILAASAACFTLVIVVRLAQTKAKLRKLIRENPWLKNDPERVRRAQGQ